MTLQFAVIYGVPVRYYTPAGSDTTVRHSSSCPMTPYSGVTRHPPSTPLPVTRAS